MGERRKNLEFKKKNPDAKPMLYLEDNVEIHL